MSERRRVRFAALVVVGGLVVFWVSLFVAGSANPAYSHRRDYVSALAARGVEDAWLGMLAIAAIGIAGVAAAVLVWRVSRSGAVTLAAAGLGFVVVALVRIDCPSGAARCGLGGRFELGGEAPTITHWTFAVVSTVLVIVGMALVAAVLLRCGSRVAGTGSTIAAAVTLVALLATGGQSPGWIQRVWIVVISAWLVGAAALALTSERR